MNNPVTPELIASIYEGALDPARWPQALAQICAVFQGRGCSVWGADMATGAADFQNGSGQLAGTYGYDDAAVASYVEYYSKCDVWCARSASLQVGQASAGSALFPCDRLRHTEWYNDWLRGQDLFHVVGGCLGRSGTQTHLVGVLRAEGMGDYAPQEVDWMRQLLPHLRNASRLHCQASERSALASSAIEALEKLNQGVLLFARSGKLLYATLRARQVLAQVSGLRLGAQALEFVEFGRELCALQAMLRGALAAGNGLGVAHGGEVLFDTAQGKVACQVTPLPPGRGGLSGLAGAALFCHAAQVAVDSMADMLRARFHMTPAEACLTQALVNGVTLKEHAARREVSLNTVRSQLKSAVAKAGARRQADLVRIVLTDPGVAAQAPRH